jgi:hypothetical protein
MKPVYRITKKHITVAMKNIVLIILFTLIIISCETNIFGPNEGTVKGTVQDIYNNPIKGANVKITYFEINKDGNQTEKSITRASDSSGAYVADVPLAEIGVFITKNGYQEVTFYDYLEQDNSKRSFSTRMIGNPAITTFRVINNPVTVIENDTMHFSVNITDEYKFKKQEPYWALLSIKEGDIDIRTYEIEIPYFSSSFKVFHNKIGLNANHGDTLRPGSEYILELLVIDSDELKSNTLQTTLKIR